jgi:hypothetical protein
MYMKLVDTTHLDTKIIPEVDTKIIPQVNTIKVPTQTIELSEAVVNYGKSNQ